MRSILTALVLILLAAVSQAQIFAVSFKDDKVARKYKEHLVTIGGESVVVGEGKFSIYLEGTSIKYSGAGKNELWVSDPADPSFVPYKYNKDGERIPTNPKGVCDISGEHIKNIRVLIADQSLAGMAEEYRGRLAKIQELMSERDAATKASREWFMAHQRVLSNYPRLQTWLATTCFPVAAKRLDNRRGPRPARQRVCKQRDRTGRQQGLRGLCDHRHCFRHLCQSRLRHYQLQRLLLHRHGQRGRLPEFLRR